MSDLEFGIVKSFNPYKSYGFLYVIDEEGNPTQEEVYFHYNSGRFVSVDGDEPTFGSRTAAKAGEVQSVPAPDYGNKIVFRRIKANKGFQAYPWAYANAWNRMAGRLLQPKYRLMRTTTGLCRQNEGHVEVSCVWTGHDLAELSVTYPVDEMTTANGPILFDSLTVTTTDDSMVAHHFEVLKGDEWLECDDPRAFLCCVSAEDFAEFARKGQMQGSCKHQD